MSALRLLALALALVSSAACATPGRVKTDIWHSLTPEQQKEAAVLERAMIRLCEYAWTQGSLSCYLPRVVIVGDGITPHYNPGSNTIYMPRRALSTGGRYAAAHELGHWYLGHNAQRCGDPAACEMEANWAGFQILREGYGYDGDTAWRIMHQYLQRLVESKRKPSKGHPPACVELNDYLRRSEMPPHQCEEPVGVVR